MLALRAPCRHIADMIGQPSAQQSESMPGAADGGQAEPFARHALADNRLAVFGEGPALRAALVELIDGARESLKLYYYIFAQDGSGRIVLARLIRALRRGVAVTLMVDAFGCADVPAAFFDRFRRAGGRFAFFGARWSTRYLIRNHQKMAIADDARALVGGFNVSDAYFGLPEDNCWHDLGLLVEGSEAAELARWHGALWQWVSDERRGFRSLRALVKGWRDERGPFRWLVGGPSNRLSPWARCVRADMGQARRVDMVAAYFAPGQGMLRRIGKAARRGAARLVLASRSDNGATVAAARLLYGPLLRKGVEIHEYQPCKLHMKLLVVDDAVYIGSANFDMRSLFLNLEIMLRIEDAAFAQIMRDFIDGRVAESEHITRAVHAARRTPWRLLKGWISYLLVAVLDYNVTRRLNFRG